ncbi:beta-ketoacyl-ACP synthase [Pararhizobium mangrovi]|uniref:Beta-ketoacyl-ACP synthase n=1 Tax=Pararhizobium mangrovi TaxID=2590452 RepID=A0A506UEB5_9HYPH|nr:beta-ketoacyl-ACP synthase [Pararhizobium mangrovi]TPW31304.1 beta-ketoacyl-ACP synthase [Pararhizobium mangrovi]
MSEAANDVVITGVGLVTAQGVGNDAHVALLTGSERDPHVDARTLAPYPVHPKPEIDWSQQIPRRGDQRQMGDWQRLGVYASGLALDDAGLKDDAEACAAMDMVIAAGGGERDQSVDSMIVDAAAERDDHDALVNEKLTSELRPTLFLAQLSNLLAGNISIVHKVTGSSRTFMGEEAAGISAVETAAARIRAGQSTQALVGGSLNAERADMLLLVEAASGAARGEWSPVWARENAAGGGIVLGSGGAFVILESRKSANARGATIHAHLSGVAGDRGARTPDRLAERMRRLAEETGALEADAPLVLSGASGLKDITRDERAILGDLFPHAPVRGYGSLTGHLIEPTFPLGIALAALALKANAAVAPFDAENEAPMRVPAKTAIVTTLGHVRGEGMAVLQAEDANG